MMVPYALRLLCICLAAFFVVNTGAGLFVSLGSRAAMRIAEKMRPRTATRFLLLLRLFPSALGLGVVVALCIPSYLCLEPESIAERVGWACLALVFVTAVTMSVSLTRAVGALVTSQRFHWTWQKFGRPAPLPGEHPNAVIIENEAPLLALAGLFRPRLFISGGVLRALTAEELDVAIRHENAHRFSRDNLKRLLLLLTPVSIPFPGFALLEQSWAKLSEWAADDEAVQGDSNRALLLATALLRVARLGAGPRLSFLHTSLVADDRELSARVDRLLHVEERPVEPDRQSRYYLALCGGLSFAACALLFASGPAALSSVHRLLEMFLR
jgi:Zn-dependent protease with chaperone function